MLVMLLFSACHSDSNIACSCDGPPPPCGQGGCEQGACETTTERCECAAHGGVVVCEPLECPQQTVQEGTACTQPGLVCDPDFEFSGFMCVAPENTWVACSPRGTYDSRCPLDAPTPGAPCCWQFSGQLDPCAYGDVNYSCQNNHWTAI
jgi:hypothetical protein